MGLFTDGFKELKIASEPLYKTPKSIQETIEIMKVAENGIFEVAKNRFSKCYRFQDINYTTTNEVEQIDIFERYCKFLNSLDVSFKITINDIVNIGLHFILKNVRPYAASCSEA